MIFTGLTPQDQARIHQELEKAFHETMEILGRQFIASITSSKWQWPSGDSPRDIVDKGRLRDSQEIVYTNFGTTFVWNVGYAAAVHEGVVFKNGTTLPPRRWTEDAMNTMNIQIVFSTLFQLYSGLEKI